MLSPKQKRFVELYHVTGNASEAYAEAYGIAKAAASTSAWRALRRPEVRDYLAEMEGDAREFVEATREEIVEYLLSVVLTPVGDLTPESVLAQEWSEDEKGIRVKMPSKIAAIQELNRMLGFHGVHRVEVTAEADVVEMLRTLTGANANADER
jgi:phage terminase small subunit